jgi:hypothetical protein
MRFILLIIAILFLAACGNTEESVDENDAEQDEAGSVDFRNIDVQTEDLEVNVTGQASTDSNEFYYRVEEAGDVIMEEARVSLEEAQTDWREFEIMLDLSEKYSNNNEEPPIILLYGKNSEGEMVNPNYIPIDL